MIRQLDGAPFAIHVLITAFTLADGAEPGGIGLPEKHGPLPASFHIT